MNIKGKKSDMTLEQAFKVLKLGFQWGCGRKKISSLTWCITSIKYIVCSFKCWYQKLLISFGRDWSKINPENLTESQLLKAFQEEVQFVGINIQGHNWQLNRQKINYMQLSLPWVSLNDFYHAFYPRFWRS